jgi:hypothetical protein
MSSNSIYSEMGATLDQLQNDALLDAAAEERGKTDMDRLVDKAKPPKKQRTFDRVHKQFKGLTEQQQKFCDGLIKGWTQRRAYREAYPNSAGVPDIFVSTYAYKLVRHPLIISALEAAADESIECMIQDQGAAKRWIFKQLLMSVNTCKQEGSKLRALELCGRSVGLFRDEQAEAQALALTTEQLKKSLDEHIEMIEDARLKAPAPNNFVRTSTVQDVDITDTSTIDRDDE